MEASREGLHPLLIGKKGCGLTTFAKIIASLLNKNYEFLLCCSETSVEDLIGCYQPKIKNNNIQDLSNYIIWNDGPILRAGKNGTSVILDNINYSKPQVIECLNPLLEDNSKYNIVKYNVLEKENEAPIEMKKGFVIIGTMVIDENNDSQISKALMNRFVAIYLDEYLDTNENNLENIIENRGKLLNIQINECLENYRNKIVQDINKEDEIDNEYKDNSDDDSEGEKKDNDNNNDINDNDNDYIKKNGYDTEKLPEWYNIKSISNETIKEIKHFFKKEKLKMDNIKYYINKISKLSFVYERIHNFGFSMKDCNDFLEFNFNADEQIYKSLEKKILIESKKEEKNKFFFNNINTDSWKMIMILISSNISNTSVFLQGAPGSGKSCAVRHFGAYRSFMNRNPILSVNCHRDLKFDYLVGNYTFKNSKFYFVDGPLLTAMKNGEPILLDEFNLCPEKVLINLLPILKSNINDKIYLKGVPEPIYIKPGFLLIATGNSSKETGRNIITTLITDEMKIAEINNINLTSNLSLIENILKNEYSFIYQENNLYDHYKISAEQIMKIDNALKNIVQFKLSLRQIKCLFERISRFCVEDFDNNSESFGLKKIPVIYVLISFIIPQLKIGKKIEELLKQFNEIMKYNKLKEIIEFINSKVEIEVIISENEQKKRYIKKGIIKLETRMNEDKLPEVALQTYFWIRMSCSLKSELPSDENLLLAGTTSYKHFLLNEWLSPKYQKEKIIDTFFLTKNTETENLIGNSSLDDKTKLNIQIKNLIDNAIFYFKLDIKVEDKGDDEEKYEKVIEQIKKLLKDVKYKKNLPLKYIYKCIKKFQKLKQSFEENENENQIGLKTVTSFNLGIIPKDYIFGKKLILKGIENPEPSVIERLNPILENPKYLILTEDNQEIFNDEKIFKNIYKTNKKSIPANPDFSIILTSRELFHGRLSEAFLSRCTIINCPNYENEKYLTIHLNPLDNYKIICRSIVENFKLYEEIIKFNSKFGEIEKIEILKFIRLCKSSKNIFENIDKIEYKSTLLYNKNKEIKYKYIIGISALRSIIDRYDLDKREKIIKNHFQEYLPEIMYKLLTNDLEIDLEEPPFKLITFNKKKYIQSKYSGIILEYPEDLEPNFSSLKTIKWSKSSVDIADAILVALVSEAILIIEGPPGRGKTAISKAVYNFLFLEDDNIKRINFSPSTTIDDVFSRIIPKIDGKKVLTQRKEQCLLDILKKSENSTEFYKQGIILDEINLASDVLLEFLYSYLISIFNEDGTKNENNRNYISPDGIKYINIGKIGVIATMNDAKISNSRISLSNTFLNLCHYFKLPNYTLHEIKLLSDKIIRKNSNNLWRKDEFNRVIKCFEISQEYSKKYSESGGNTFREILKLGQFIDKCKEIPLEYLLELILCTNIPISELENFKNESGLNMVSNSLSDLKLKIENKYLCFDKFAKYKLIKDKNYEIKTQFTIPQKEAIMKIMIGLLAERPILLTGDIGTGKTFIIEKLADIIGANLKVIQFNSETTSLDIIGRLELTVDQNKLKEIKNSIKQIKEKLIKFKYKKIIEFIVLSESLDQSLKNFLGNTQNFPDVPKEIKDEINEVIQKDFIGLEKTHFNFNLSVLIEAMKKGEWILLDDINFAPQEIEGLMSLLEEDPTLTIYENDPVLFFTKNKNKIKNEKTDFLIHPNFRLFITSSNFINISSAIKSRCVCIKINPFKEPKDYAELISNSLINTSIADNNIIEISKKIGYSFYELKKKENQSNYILKNYILSSVNLVNLSKLIDSEQPIDDKKLAQIIEFSIFTSFKQEEKIEKIKMFKQLLKEDKEIEITPIRNIKRSHEYYLSIYEIDIISYYYNKNKENIKILDNINEKINQTFKYEVKFDEKKIKKDIKSDSPIGEILRNKLVENLELFTLPEIEEYKNDIEEVTQIFNTFLDEKNGDYYFLLNLKKALDILNKINIEKIFGIKINKMMNNKNYFNQYGLPENKSIYYSKILFWFRNMIKYLEAIIPKKINNSKLENIIVCLYYKHYKKKYKENLILFLMLSNHSLRRILRKIDIIISNEKIKELYNILLFYDDPISVDIEYEEIIFSNQKISLKNLNIGGVKKNLINEIKPNFSRQLKIEEYYNNISYFYPKDFFKQENLLYIFWFYNFYIFDYIDEYNDDKFKEIIPTELLDFNELIYNIFKGEIDKLDDNTILNNDFKEIVKLGYKLLEGIEKVNDKNKMIFSEGIDLIKKSNKHDNEQKVDISLDSIYKIKKYFNEYSKKKKLGFN